MPNDILLDEDDDLDFRFGDLLIGESTRQHQRHLFLTEKGQNKRVPVSGIGIGGWQNDDDLSPLYSDVQRQFELDGMQVTSIEIFTDGKIVLDGIYN